MDRIKVPIVVYAVGWNYFKGQKVSRLFEDNLNYLINKAAFVGLRNNGSISVVESVIGKSKVCYQPCVTTVIRYVYDDLEPHRATNQVAFNMAFDREELRFGKDREEVLTQVAKAAKAISDKGIQIFYVMHCPHDIKFIPYLKKLGVKCKVVDTTMWKPEKLIRFYNKVDCVVGMRGHAQMIPFGVNCEIISLGTHEKMKWFLDDINSRDWYIDISTDKGKIAEKIRVMFNQIYYEGQKSTHARLLAEQHRLWEITRENAEQIKNLIKI